MSGVPVGLRSAAAISETLERVSTAMLRGELDPYHARVLVQACNVATRAEPLARVEQRISELEERLGTTQS